MNNIRTKIIKSSLFSSIGLVILGGMLIFQSEFAIISISYIIGAILVAIGTLALIDFVKGLNQNNKNELDIVYGIVTIIMGIIVIGNPQEIASIIPFVVGIIVIISSATKLQYSLDLKKSNSNLWKPTMIISIFTMLCGVLLVFNPFKGAEIFTKIIGSLILIYAILDIISTLSINKTIKKMHIELEEHITEAEIVNEEVATEKEEPKTEKKNKKEQKKEDSDE